MKTTTGFLDEVKAAHNLKSDYALAQFLEVRHTNISNYRTGRSHFDAEMALKIAGVLNLNPGYVLASIEAERAKNDKTKAAWQKVAQTLGGVAAGVAIVAAGFTGLDMETAPLLLLATGEANTLYIMLNGISGVLDDSKETIYAAVISGLVYSLTRQHEAVIV